MKDTKKITIHFGNKEISEEICIDESGIKSKISPDGIISILFTDIVDSTKITEELGDGLYKKISWTPIIKSWRKK